MGVKFVFGLLWISVKRVAKFVFGLDERVANIIFGFCKVSVKLTFGLLYAIAKNNIWDFVNWYQISIWAL